MYCCPAIGRNFRGGETSNVKIYEFHEIHFMFTKFIISASAYHSNLRNQLQIFPDSYVIVGTKTLSRVPTLYVRPIY